MTRSPRCSTLLGLVMAMAMLLVPAAPAHANYAAGATTGCGGYNFGGRDAAGNLYMPCSGSVRIVGPDGRVIRTAAINTAVHAISPSPDGAYLYANSPNGAFRLARGADGTYRRDGFVFQAPAHYAVNGWKVCGWGIATDAYGKIYISNGGWCQGNPNEILKYAPDGKLITRFGDYGVATKWYACGTTNCVEWNRKGSVPGLFQPAMGIAVTRDGNRVWVADQNNQRVQVFERNEDTVTYGYRTMWSGEGTAFDGQAGAVYGVAVDAWGHGYVAMTTARVIWRLAPDATAPVLVADWRHQLRRPHTLAVDGRGSVWVGEWGVKFDRTTATPGPVPVLPPEPKPDAAAPVVAKVTAPGETTAPTVAVSVDATDDIAVTHMRIADESGEWRAWEPFRSSFDHALSHGLGTKVLYVQVRDKVGRESNVQWATTMRRPVPDESDPVVRLAAPATSTTSTISLGIDASDDIGVTHVRFASEQGTFSDWQPWSSGSRTVTHELTAGLGPRIVAVQVRDAAFKVSGTAQATVVVALPPVPEQVPVPAPVAVPAPIVAAGGEAAVAAPAVARDSVAPRVRRLRISSRSCSRRIVVRIAASDDRKVAQVRFANEDGRFLRWRPYRATTVHFLSPRAGRKAVYVQLRDAAGNVSRSSVRRVLLTRCATRDARRPVAGHFVGARR